MSVRAIPILLSPETYARLIALQRHPSEAPEHLILRLLNAASPATAPMAKDRAEKPPPAVSEGRITYTLFGEQRGARNANAAMLDILRALHGRDASVLPRLAREVIGNSRNHLASERLLVYPGRPDLAKYVRELVPGWWIGTNISNAEKIQILQAACRVADIAFGRDLRISL